MTIEESNNILKKLNSFADMVNNTITDLDVETSFNENEISIKIVHYPPENNNVAKFIYNKTYELLQKNEYYNDKFHIGTCKCSFCGKMEKENFTVMYDYQNNDIVIKSLVEALYYAVDEAKVEFCFCVEGDFVHEIPNTILWELDVWNEGWMDEGEEEEHFIADEDLKVYRIKKECLHSICLGYYTIDLSLFESDVVPELIGIVFNSVEDFCYVTSYENEDWIYIYSAKELNEDNLFDIEEGLFSLLGLISPAKDFSGETLEEYFSIVRDENDC